MLWHILRQARLKVACVTLNISNMYLEILQVNFTYKLVIHPEKSSLF